MCGDRVPYQIRSFLPIWFAGRKVGNSTAEWEYVDERERTFAFFTLSGKESCDDDRVAVLADRIEKMGRDTIAGQWITDVIGRLDSPTKGASRFRPRASSFGSVSSEEVSPRSTPEPTPEMRPRPIVLPAGVDLLSTLDELSPHLECSDSEVTPVD